MIQFIIALIFLALSLTAVTLLKTYYYLPAAELKRQAADKQSLAQVLWRAVAFGGSLQLLLWGVVGLGGAIGVVMFTHVAPTFLGVIAVALLLWMSLVWIPKTRLTSVGARLAVWFTPSIVWVLSILRPVMDPLAALASRFPLAPHTGLYEKEDLLRVVEQQNEQVDNRISPDALALAHKALQFDDYKIADVLVSRSKVKSLAAKEPIGPILMDELHALGHTRFPVYEDDKNVIKGTLYLRDLVDSKQSGTVKDYADAHVFYVHESDSLTEALRAFRRAKQQMLVVVNSFEEYVGIVTITDVLRKLIELDEDSFQHYDDKRAVAAKHEQPVAPPKDELDEPTDVVETPSEVIE
jgi:CBS domain containing-hemolysin-like protein